MKVAKFLALIIFTLFNPSIKAQTASPVEIPYNFEPIESNISLTNINFLAPKDTIVSLTDFKDKVVILSYWSVSCPPCVAMLASLDKLAQEIEDVIVIPVCLGQDTKIFERVQNIYHTQEIKKLDMLLDHKRTAFDIFKVRGTPTTFVINKAGEVVGRVQGKAQWHSKEFIDFIQSIQKGKTISSSFSLIKWLKAKLSHLRGMLS